MRKSWVISFSVRERFGKRVSEVLEGDGMKEWSARWSWRFWSSVGFSNGIEMNGDFDSGAW